MHYTLLKCRTKPVGLYGSYRKLRYGDQISLPAGQFLDIIVVYL